MGKGCVVLGKGSRYFSILIVPDDGSKTLEFRINQRAIHAFKAISFVLLGLILLTGFCYWRTAEQAAMVSRVERENRRLAAENQKVRELSKTLEQVTAIRRRLMAMLSEGMPQEQEVDSWSGDWSNPSAFAHPSRNGSVKLRPQEWGRWRPAIWPVDGWIVKEFGDEAGFSSSRQRGVDIAPESGALVRATADGAVMFAGWNEELGNLLVIDHGGKYSTWYSGSVHFLVREGEWVQMGQAVALVRSQTADLDASFHYIVWQGDRVRDPRAYLVR